MSYATACNELCHTWNNLRHRTNNFWPPRQSLYIGVHTPPRLNCTRIDIKLYSYLRKLKKNNRMLSVGLHRYFITQAIEQKKNAGVSLWVLFLLNYPGLSSRQVFRLFSWSTISLSLDKKEHNEPCVLFSFFNSFLLLRYKCIHKVECFSYSGSNVCYDNLCRFKIV